ncbi:MAG: hypothetical protein HZB39_02940, partial [Planctomycetes bacterium]|nr:hypothetical protein [Planctomycetota bacterium]
MPRPLSGLLVASIAAVLAPRSMTQTAWAIERWTGPGAAQAYDPTLCRFVSAPWWTRDEFDGTTLTRVRSEIPFLRLPPYTPFPRPLSAFSAYAYDTVLRRHFMYGGREWSSGDFLTDVWLSDENSWSRIVADPNPGPRLEPGVAFDSQRRVFVLFGGADETTVFDETWEFDGRRWRHAPSVTRPLALTRPQMAFDEFRGRTVLYDGADTWEWDGVTWAGFPSTGSPSPRSGAALVYDHRRRAVLLVGGDTSAPSVDLWAWTGTRWSPAFVPNGPPGRAWMLVLSDPAQQVLHVFGGTDGRNGSAGDSWRLTDRWQLVLPPLHSAPVPFFETARELVWDPANERVMALVATDSGFPSARRVQVWEGNQWRIIPTTIAPPSSTWIAGWPLAADLRRRRVVCFVNRETWEWDGRIWQRLQPAHEPPLWAAPALAFDPLRGRTVLVCGGDSTWEWDGLDWTQRAGPETPSVGIRALAWHATSRKLVAIAGYSPQTWEWDGTAWTRRGPAHEPPPVASLVEDPVRGRVVCLSRSADSGYTRAVDTFEWDGNDWLEVTDRSRVLFEPSPSAAFDHRTERILTIDRVSSAPEVWGYGPLHPASAEPFGAACSGSLGPVALDALARPWLGDRCTLRAMPLPRDAAILVAGLSDRVYHSLTLPVDLALLGAPG